MATLADYAYQSGQDRDQIRVELSALLGKRYQPLHINRYWDREIPKSWADALGLRAVTPPPIQSPLAGGVTDDPPAPEGSSERQAERPPEAPPGAPIAPTSAQVKRYARNRIAKTYGFLGASAAMAIDPHGANHDHGAGGGVVRVWSDFSGPIADAWISAAEDNVWARKFVEMMSAGGSAGELVMLHVGLVGSTLYVMGQIPEVGPFFSKYRKYRPEPAAASPSTNGAGPADAVTVTADEVGARG